ncbi:MAG: radical SAM protein [Dehalococcoidales bacterium]|nr:radical SAM protein [Dehalococcoidales bacterium]
MAVFEPGYLALYRSGELKRRAEALEARLASCDICPRKCGVNRLKGETGFCHSGALPIVDTVCQHLGEEPPLSGSKGSGTVFFGNCNLRCVYCQNHQISQNRRKMRSKEMDGHTLTEKLLYLQNELGCHNINFVSPSHFVSQIVTAVLEAVPMGLRLPLVYNTSGYDSLETIKALHGIIDIYLPDLRYASNKIAKRFSQSLDYVEHARKSIKEMYSQVGNLVINESGIALKGLIVRHLILPARLAGSEESLTWLAQEVSPEVSVSIMAQYYPTHHSGRFSELSRVITEAEYSEVFTLLEKLGMENGWIQEMSAPDNYQPDFERDSHPFNQV